jgi:hypothetical protein
MTEARPDRVPGERRRIECVGLRPTGEPQARIASIGGAEGRAAWRMSAQEAIEALEDGRIGFYVIVGGTARDVVIGDHRGRRYLKTDGDHKNPNHLLVLPDCPGNGEEQG